MAQTRLAGVSVSQVARRYDVNANLVFTWRRDPRFNPPPVEDPAALFLPVEVVVAPAIIDPPALEPPAAKIEIVLPTAIASASAARTTPMRCAGLCAGWVDDPGSGIDEGLAGVRRNGHAQGVCRFIGAGRDGA